MKHIFYITCMITVFTYASCGQSQSGQHVGGSCEGCEAIFESPVDFKDLKSVVTLPDFSDPGPKLEISGIVYNRDGKTPAKDVVIYVYHTDQKGIYPTKGNEKGWGKRHGYIRGWVKTDKNGFYQIFTLRPASYPNRKDPAHIHVTVKEPDKNEYWIDEFLFSDDPLLKNEPHLNRERGGNGILEVQPAEKGISHATRHIFLGLNVPDYPYKGLPKLNSGLTVGSNCPAFDPLHLSGVDSGKKACPMCKYGYGEGIILWFNHTNIEQMKNIAVRLEQEMAKRQKKNFRVFLVYMNPSYDQNNSEGIEILRKKIRLWCAKQNLKKVAMVMIPSPIDKETAGLYEINPEAKNTVFVYKKRKVIAKWVNVEYDDNTLDQVLKTL